MDGMKVTLPFDRVKEAAAIIGSQDSTCCPPGERRCWLQRAGEQSYMQRGSVVDDECANCWVHYMMTGQ